MRIGIQTGTGAVHCVLSAENSGGSTVLKRRDSVTLVLHWIAEDGTGVTALATGSAIHAALRPAGSYSGTPLALCTTFVYSATEKTYTGTLALNTTEMDTVFAALASTDDDDLQCALEITWSADGSAWNSTPRIPVTVENDVVTGSESPPSTSVAPWALPSDGTAGQVLTTNGTVATWETVESGDVGDLTTDGLTPGRALVVDDPGGVTELALGSAATAATTDFAAASHAASHAIDGVTWIATNVAAESTILPAAIVSRTAGTYKLVVAVTFSVDPTNRTIVFGRSGTGEFKDPADGTATASIDAQGTEFTMQCGAGDGTTRYAFVTFTCAGTETISATGVSGTINSVSVGVISRETAQTDTVMVDAASQAIGILPLANGGTGAATAGAALTNLGATAVGSSLVTAATAGAAVNALGTLKTTSPCDTVNSLGLAIDQSAGSANVSLNLQAKGTGAFYLGPPADGTVTGGNVRGSRAVDLQTQRGAGSHVASGAQSTVIGGISNTASGGYAVAGGHANTASGSSSFAFGSYSNASGTYSRALGYYARASRHGETALANGRFTAAGDCQTVDFYLSCRTATNAAVEMALDGAATYLTFTSGKVMSGTINVHGVNSDGSVVAHYMRQFSLRNQSNVLSSVDVDTDVLTFASPHGLAVDDAIRITGGTLPTGLTSGVVYYVESVPAANTLTLKDSIGGSKINITGAGSGTRTMSSTKMLYPPVTLGTDNAAGTSLSVTAKTVAGATLADYLSIMPTGLAAGTPITGCTAEADDDVITKTAHGLTDGTPVFFSSLTGGTGLTPNSVIYYVRDKTDNTFKVAPGMSGWPPVDITVDYSDMTVVPATVMRWTAHVSAVETGYGT